MRAVLRSERGRVGLLAAADDVRLGLLLGRDNLAEDVAHIARQDNVLDGDLAYGNTERGHVGTHAVHRLGLAVTLSARISSRLLAPSDLRNATAGRGRAHRRSP